MIEALYNRFVKPRSPNPEQAEREVVLNYLLLGVIGLAAIALLDTALVYLVIRENYLVYRIMGILLFIAIAAGLYILARRRQYFKLVAVTLTWFVTAISLLTAYRWSIFIPTGLLLCSLAVVMAGILINARYSLYVAVAVAAVLSFLQYGQSHGVTHPDIQWLAFKPTVGDVIGFSAILLIIALVSWLFNRQMELSLQRAVRSEKALQRQRDLLEVKVEERAKQLEASQLEKMQQIYRFAELGRLSTALFHDLANHLSSVSVDIEGLSEREQSDIMRRISQNIGHIDAIVRRVRQQIRGQTSVEVFNVLSEIEEVLKILEPMAGQAKVEVRVVRAPGVAKSLSYRGDTIRFRQVIINLVTNAIEAYKGNKTVRRGVEIGLDVHGKDLIIKVTDHGKGISRKDRENIFRPFYTTKQKGSGIGLFIVEQIVEHDFGGELNLESDGQTTTFTATLPRNSHAK